MAVKFAVSFGAEVTVISSSKNKEEDAKKLGANYFVVSSQIDQSPELVNKFDVIINTISANIDYNLYIKLLNIGGVLVLLGVQQVPSTLNSLGVVFGRRVITGSLIGGLKETQEMLDYCDKNNVLPEVEIIKMEQINSAFERMEKSDVKYRFVIDICESRF
jgi:uncharacterized zinc-type alcohol dehydrogenase-like protein